MRHVDPERLTLLALDEDVASSGASDDDGRWARNHLAECPVCHREYAALRHVVDVGRDADADDLQPPPPPPRVWDAIEAQLAAEDQLRAERPLAPEAPPAPVVHLPERRPAGRRLLIAAAACVSGVVLGAGVTLGVQELRRPADPGRAVVASTSLAPVGDAGAGGVGDARLVRTGDRLSLEIDARDLPLTNGFYEAWMFVPGTTRMQAMGAIQPGEVARFPVPAGLDPAGWRGIDISEEAFDGDPAHSATSVLRGELRQ